MASKKVGLIIDERHPLLTVIDSRLKSLSLECDYIPWRELGGRDLGVYDALYLDRMGEACFSYATQILLLEKHQAKMPNAPMAYFRSRDKSLSKEVFEANGIPHPVTSYAFSRESALLQISRGPELQLLKSIQGYCAKEVVPFNKADVPLDFLDRILARDGMILRQDFVKGAQDYIWRIDIVNDKIIVANQRHKFNLDGLAMCNGTHGGRVDFWHPDKVPPAIAKLALEATRALGLKISGVDILEGTEGTYVLEVNPEPDITLDRYEFPQAIADYLKDIGEKRRL